VADASDTAIHRVRRAYDAMAETYDQVEADGFYANQYVAYQEQLQRFAGRLTGQVLDVGCGTGIQTTWLAERAKLVAGLDLSASLLATAETKCTRFGNVILLQGDAAQLPFPDASFDAVVSLGETLSHLTNPVEGFSEIARVLRPAGTFLFSVLNKWNLGVLRSPPEFLAAVRSRSRGHTRVWACTTDTGCEVSLPLRTFTRGEIIDLGRRLGFLVEDSTGIHVSSLLVPLRLQGTGHPLDRVYRALGRIDAVIGRGALSNFGYTTIYMARRY
jgi:ubiquinone/menaquinone biosynthesis C-methylase UbiE